MSFTEVCDHAVRPCVPGQVILEKVTVLVTMAFGRRIAGLNV